MGKDTHRFAARKLQFLVGTLIFVIVVEAVLQAVLAIGAGQVPASTAHDRQIGARASRNAYVVLMLGVLATFAARS